MLEIKKKETKTSKEFIWPSKQKFYTQNDKKLTLTQRTNNNNHKLNVLNNRRCLILCQIYFFAFSLIHLPEHISGPRVLFSFIWHFICDMHRYTQNLLSILNADHPHIHFVHQFWMCLRSSVWRNGFFLLLFFTSLFFVSVIIFGSVRHWVRWV